MKIFTTKEFDKKLEAILEDEIKHHIEKSFIDVLGGEWDRDDIGGLLDKIRSISKDKNGVDLLLLYLFAELLNDGRLEFTWLPYKKDDELDPDGSPDVFTDFSRRISGCYTDGNKIFITRAEGTLTVELKEI